MSQLCPPYLLVLGGHLAHQHGDVVGVPHPGVTGEILQDHHGFVETSDCLHHPAMKEQMKARWRRKKGRKDGGRGGKDAERRGGGIEKGVVDDDKGEAGHSTMM